tara:strand:- start:476 stop:1231 length:756 start_codon:yes stop_codon:yes gene_type:complete
MANETGMLAGRIAIITGAASGIGAGIMQKFLDEGAQVLGVDLPSERWSNDDAPNDGLIRFAIDVTLDEAPQEIVKAAIHAFGSIDTLVNNAGISPPGSAADTSDELWRKVMALNVDAVFRLTREAVPHLKKSDNARIINTGSIMSELAGPGIIAYVTSKHAVAGMTKAMAVDLGPFGIRANFVQPGAIVTPLSEAHMADEQFVEYWNRKIPLGRLGKPADIAPVVAFLASPMADYVSGEGLRIDGGATCNM